MLSSLPAKRRALPAFAAVVLASLALSACAPGDETTGSSDPAAECAPAGDASKAVTVDGKLGAAPDVEIATPLATERTERSVVIEGDGSEPATPGDTVTVSYTLYNGSTGEEIESTGHGDESDRVPFELDEAKYLPGIVRALNCAVVGERIVAVVPPSDAFGEAGNEQFGVGADDMLVFVMDVVKPHDAESDMVVVEPDAAGMPVITAAPDGAPIVTIPSPEPPADLSLAVLTEGDGAVVADGDEVTVHYTGVNWTTGETFDSSWPKGAPATFLTNQVIPGFGAALVGQAVGSQVVVVIPPVYGYGSNGNAGAGINGTDTLVFVVDIFETAPPES